MSDASERRDQILTAALGVFGRYGYRRSTMDLIAQAARMSRPAVYQYYGGKNVVFRAVGERLIGEVLTTARLALEGDGPVADRLYGVLSAKLDLIVGALGTEVRADILAEAAEVTGDLLVTFKEAHVALVEDVLTSSAEEVDLLDDVVPAHDIAVLLVDALTGIAQDPAEPDVLRRRLRQLVDLTVRGLTSHPPTS